MALGLVVPLTYAFHCAFVLLAWLVARRDRTYRWVAGYVTWTLVLELFLYILQTAFPLSHPIREGSARVAYHTEQLLTLSWYFLFLALCIHHFLRRSPAAALGAWVAVWIVCLDYPRFTGDQLAWLYNTASIVTLVCSWACILWGMLRIRDLQPGLSHLILIFYACTDVGLQLLLSLRGFFENWPVVQLANLLLFAGCVAAHVWWLVRRRDRRAHARPA